MTSLINQATNIKNNFIFCLLIRKVAIDDGRKWK